MVKKLNVDPLFIKKAVKLLVSNGGPVSMQNVVKNLERNFPNYTKEQVKTYLRYSRELWCRGLVTDEGEFK